MLTALAFAACRNPANEALIEVKVEAPTPPPVPVATPEPTPEPATEPAPAPEPKPVSVPAPETVSVPALDSMTREEREAVYGKEVQRLPNPIPIVELAPAPVPQAEPVPQPIPAPIPVPAPAPLPVLATEPAPTPEVTPAPEPISPNAAYNAFLAKYIVPQNGINLVRYGDVSAADKAALDGYIDTLSQSGPPSGAKEDIMAYWFNLYNAKTVSMILDNYPLNSIRDISKPWKKKRLIVNGTPMSLDNIEHDTVRAAYDEPRVHYAFNCASIGCPNLKASAWQAATLEADLSQAAHDYIASARGISVDSKGRIDASKIYKWYKADFGGSEAGILAHVARYATGAKKDAILANSKIDDFDYNWSLNIAH